MALWFTADTHFGHGAALGRWKRPFASVSEMNEALVARWNARVAPADEVWHLGDFAYRLGPDRAGLLLGRLHGRKHLLRGNNDTDETAWLPGWASVGHYAEIDHEGVRLVMGHYAFRTWNGMYKGALNLHGHSHGALSPLPRQVDVGVDVWGYAPVSLPEIRSARGRRNGPARLAGAAKRD